MILRRKNKLIVLFLIGYISITSCLIGANSSRNITPDIKKDLNLVKNSSIENIMKTFNESRVNNYTLSNLGGYPTACGLSSDKFAVKTA